MPVDTSRQNPDWLVRLPHYSVHYAVRNRRALDDHKPFLKGFTAAACEAVVVVDTSQTEPRHWLPAEYPYWVDGDDREQAATNILDRVREDFGSSTWTSATHVMRDIADRTSTERISSQLRELFA